MKKIIISILVFGLAGCASTPDFNKVQQKISKVEKKVEKTRRTLSAIPAPGKEVKAALDTLEEIVDDINGIKGRVSGLEMDYFSVADERDEYKRKYNSLRAWVWSFFAFLFFLLLGVVAYGAAKLYIKFGPPSAVSTVNGLLSRIPFKVPGLSGSSDTPS